MAVENIKVESEAGANEVKIKLPVLAGHLEGGHTQAINILMYKIVKKGLVEEESMKDKLSFKTNMSNQSTKRTQKQNQFYS